jgi:hypothetical protein
MHGGDEMHTKFQSDNLEERDHLGELAQGKGKVACVLN